MRQLRLERKEIRVVLVILLLWMISPASGEIKNTANWQYNDPQYDGAQYAKLYSQVTGINPTKEKMEPFQYQYVDYEPNCSSGGQPVCATNGVKYFYFENDCKLEEHNVKLLFQYGTELEPTELERCMPNCDTIKCTTKYVPVCAAPESGPHRGKGITFANECEVRRHECNTKQTHRFVNKGPCRQLKQKSKSKSRSKGRRKHRRGHNTNSTATHHRELESEKVLATMPSSTEAPRKRTITTTTTTTTAPMKYHEYLSRVNPGVSVSQAVHAYNVYNIPDVGKDYNEITDSSLSFYLPGLGTVTDTPPKTTSTTTTTPIPQLTLTTLPTTSSTKYTTLAPRTTTPRIIFFLAPFGTTSTTTVRSLVEGTRNVATKLPGSVNRSVNRTISRNINSTVFSRPTSKSFVTSSNTTASTKVGAMHTASFKGIPRSSQKLVKKLISMPTAHKIIK